MRLIVLLGASALALTAAGCGGGPIKARAALDCPDTQGDLTRTGKAADGKSCTYVGEDGAEVTLQLVSVQGGPDATLRAIETKLLAEAAAAAPATPQRPAPAPGPAQAAESALNNAEAARDAAAVEREAKADSAGAGAGAKSTKDAKVDVDIDVNGKDHGVVVSDGDNEKVRVDLPGIRVEADEASESARVRIGPIHVDAGDGEATFRNGPRSVRLKGEQLSTERRGLRATFIYTGDKLPSGYRYVGYEAGGPKAGPLTVAVVKGRADGDDHGRIAEDVTRLVRKNGGV